MGAHKRAEHGMTAYRLLSFPNSKNSLSYRLKLFFDGVITQSVLFFGIASLEILLYHFYSLSPPISFVISSIRSMGNGGEETGFMAMDISFIGLSSAAIRFELNAPQILQR